MQITSKVSLHLGWTPNVHDLVQGAHRKIWCMSLFPVVMSIQRISTSQHLQGFIMFLDRYWSFTTESCQAFPILCKILVLTAGDLSVSHKHSYWPYSWYL